METITIKVSISQDDIKKMEEIQAEINRLKKKLMEMKVKLHIN